MKFESDSRGPGRVIDRRNIAPPRFFDRTPTYKPSAVKPQPRNAIKLGLNAYSAASLRSKTANGWKAGMPKMYKTPDRKLSTRSNMQRFTNGSRYR